MSKKIQTKQSPIGIVPSQWAPYCITAGILDESNGACRSERGKSVRIGNLLSRFVGREIPISVKERTGMATLRVEKGGARKKLYYFEVRWDDATTPAKGAAGKKGAATVRTKGRRDLKPSAKKKVKQGREGGGDQGQ